MRVSFRGKNMMPRYHHFTEIIRMKISPGISYMQNVKQKYSEQKRNKGICGYKERKRWQSRTNDIGATAGMLKRVSPVETASSGAVDDTRANVLYHSWVTSQGQVLSSRATRAPSVSSFNPHKSLTNWASLFSPLYRWGNWGQERFNDMARVAQLLSG